MSQPDPDSPIQAVSAFCKLLEKLKLSYLIGGSFASSVHGEYRTTNDIDFLIKISEVDLEPLFELLKPDFIFDDIAIRNAVRERRSFNIIHEHTFIKIDVFTHIKTFQNIELERAILVELPEVGLPVKIATAEDIILSKLCWFKLGNEVSIQQWQDILGVMKVQGRRLDQTYLKTQADNLDISVLLEKALAEVTNVKKD